MKKVNERNVRNLPPVNPSSGALSWFEARCVVVAQMRAVMQKWVEGCWISHVFAADLYLLGLAFCLHLEKQTFGSKHSVLSDCA